MLLISDNGCLNGNDSQGNVRSFETALAAGFCVQAKIWKLPKAFFTGIFKPEHLIDPTKLDPDKMLYKAENYDALQLLRKMALHCFCRDRDDVVLTNKNLMLCYGSTVLPQSIAMDPELVPSQHLSQVGGICSRYINGYKT